MIGTYGQLLTDRKDLGYLFGEGDPPARSGRRKGRTPPAKLYARADHQTMFVPAVIGDTSDGDQPAQYEVGGALAKWLDANCPVATQ